MTELDRLARARALLSVRRYENALEEANRAAAAEPADPDVYVVRAAALLGLERPADAINAAERAIALDPRSVRGHVARAQGSIAAFLPVGPVVDSSHRAVELDPDDDLAWYTLVRAQILAGDPRAAAVTANRMRERFPAAVNTDVALALAALAKPAPWQEFFHEMPRGPRVVVVVVVVVALLSGLGLVVFVVAVTANRLHLYRTAAIADSHLERALTQDPENPRLHDLRADFASAQGRLGSSITSRLRAGRIDPTVASTEQLTRDLHLIVSAAAAVAAVAVAVVAGIIIDQVHQRHLLTEVGVACTVAAGLVGLAAPPIAQRWGFSHVPAATATRVHRVQRPAILATGPKPSATPILWGLLAPLTLDPEVRTLPRTSVALLIVPVVAVTTPWAILAPLRKPHPSTL